MINKNKFLDPDQVLFRAGLNKGSTVVDMGAGSGHFAIAAGKITGDTGKVYVIDIVDSSLDHVMAEARVKNLKNIETVKHDLEKGSAKINDGVADLIIASNIFHQVKKMDNLFKEAYRMLKTGGKFLIVDWNDTPIPFGPKPESRISEEAVKKSGAKYVKFVNEIETDNYHFGLIFIK